MGLIVAWRIVLGFCSFFEKDLERLRVGWGRGEDLEGLWKGTCHAVYTLVVTSHTGSSVFSPSLPEDRNPFG